jgi:hypothetical protein
MLSADSGKSFGDMLAASVDPSLTSYTWVVGSETGADAPFAYPSTKCILRIRDYQPTPYLDDTGIFSVAQ